MTSGVESVLAKEILILELFHLQPYYLCRTDTLSRVKMCTYFILVPASIA